MKVSVVIRSKGDQARREMLRRAIDSTLSQTGVDVEVIVVLNGDHYAPGLIQWLSENPRIVCAALPGPDKPRATALGRSLVTTEYFSFLDDDDEYLPGALARRAALLAEDPQLDCIATNGEYEAKGSTRQMLSQASTYSLDYIGALIDGRNWMASCGATFRTASVAQKYFDDTPRHYEWTAIAFRVASCLNVAFVDEPTFCVHETAVSLTKTASYVECRFDVPNDMLRWNVDQRRRSAILRKRAEAFHSACSFHRLNGNFRRAWAFHVKSLSSIYGLKYLPYTVLLLARSRSRVSELLRKVGMGRLAPSPS